MSDEDEIQAAIREIRAFLNANDPETIAFLARVGDQTEIITAGEGEHGKFEEIDMIVYYLEKIIEQPDLSPDGFGVIEANERKERDGENE